MAAWESQKADLKLKPFYPQDIIISRDFVQNTYFGSTVTSDYLSQPWLTSFFLYY